MISIKKILQILIVAAITVIPTGFVYASGSSDAINYISSGAASIDTADRKVYTGGSLRMFVPQSTAQFVSITPPTFSAGCSGIDAAFGGISFINADKFAKAVKNIMGSAKGYALDLAIRTLCPLCSDVMQKIRDVANWANGMALDSCAAAKTMVDTIADVSNFEDLKGSKYSLDSDDLKGMCQKDDGSDWYELSQICADPENAAKKIGQKIDTILAAANSGQSLTDSSDLDQVLPAVNNTIAGLVGYGIVDDDVEELLASALGMKFLDTDAKNGGGEVTLPGWVDMPMGDARGGDGHPGPGNAASVIIHILLTGSSSLDVSAITLDNEALKKLGDEVAAKMDAANTKFKDLPFYICQSFSNTGATTLGSYLQCNHRDDFKITTLGKVSKTDNAIVAGQGILPWVTTTLIQAADRTMSGKRLTQEQLALVSAAPLPVYRMLKVSAIYPRAGKKLIAQYSQLIAMMMVDEVFRNAITQKRSGGKSWPAVQNYSTVVGEMLSRIAGSISQKSNLIAEDLALTTGLLAQLQKVDKIIAERAVLSGSAGSTLFSRRIAPSGTSKH